MLHKKYIFPIFIAIVLAQLLVPLQMILSKESVLKSGSEYRFLTAPVDPNDPFRGKYITLAFQDNTLSIKDSLDWKKGDPAYVLLEKDAEGFAQIDTILQHIPSSEQDYVKATVRSHYKYRSDNGFKLRISYPFDRFYMEESKAYDAELAYRKVRRDTNSIAYALVYIDQGEAVLKDVLINDISVKDLKE